MSDLNKEIVRSEEENAKIMADLEIANNIADEISDSDKCLIYDMRRAAATLKASGEKDISGLLSAGAFQIEALNKYLVSIEGPEPLE